MTPAEAIHRFEHLRRFTRDGEHAVHKPLLALLMLGRIANGQRGPVTFAEIEPKLKELLGDFGRPSAVNTPHNPFWQLKTERTYQIRSPFAGLSSRCIKEQEHEHKFTGASNMENFDPTSFFVQKDDDLFFSATLIEGTDVNLCTVAGLEETEELSEAVWDSTNWRKLLDQCSYAVLIEEEEIDNGAPMTDVYYTYRIEDAIEFSRELRTIMLALLAKKRKSTPPKNLSLF